MKMKITIELDEGVRMTKEISIASETILNKVCEGVRGAEKINHIAKHPLRQLILSTAKDCSASIVDSILFTINKYGLLYQYEDEGGEMVFYPIQDIDEFKKLRSRIENETV